MIRNPQTGRDIKVGGAAHRRLVQQGVLERETLDQGRVSIVEGSRQKMPLVTLEQFGKSTHWTNAQEIAEAVGCSVFTLLEWFAREFDEMKICVNKRVVRVIFPTREPFIQDAVHAFVAEVSNRRGLDMTHWNQ